MPLILRLVLGDPFTDKNMENQRDKELTQGHRANYSLECLLPFRYFLWAQPEETPYMAKSILLTMLLQGTAGPAQGCGDEQFLGPEAGRKCTGRLKATVLD